MEARQEEHLSQFRINNANPSFLGRRPRKAMLVRFCLVLIAFNLIRAFGAEAIKPGELVLLATHGEVEILRQGARTWDVASTNQDKRILHLGDQLRTGRYSRALVRLADRTVAPIGADSQLLVLEPPPNELSFVEIVKGWFFFLHREKQARFKVRTRTTTAAIEGTEFGLRVEEADGTTRVDVFDGKVTMTNTAGRLTLMSGQAAVTRPGEKPIPSARIEAVNSIQWNLYYSAVLNVDDLALTASARQVLRDSLAAYRGGDLLSALTKYPAGRAPTSDSEKIYLAALLLSVGEVAQTETQLDSLSMASDLADALRMVIAAVKFQQNNAAPNAPHASFLLAESYYQQSRSNLEAAREAARKAVSAAPEFAFALARLAELEFSFGRIGPAEDALKRSLALAPHNAQAIALQGFLFAARNQTTQAIAAFDRAIILDPGLANAWLGRGLCRIRRGQVAEGLDDLLAAAATEPQRAVLRSYLGKAFTEAGDFHLAGHELELARQFDRNDPTAWLYSALLNQLDNRINRAVGDLEESQALNKNRGVYRSRQLLDQDRAVRGFNLANIYEDAGMTDVAFREAARAVHDDYGNFSTHLFLANSFNRLRDPRQVNIRYETPWLSEYLVANLLAPVGAGTLSQLVSSEEYSRLFERNRGGLVAQFDYLSSGDWLQAQSQYGQFDKWSYAFDEAYMSRTGFYPNGDQKQLSLSLRSKFQLTQRDDVFLEGIYQSLERGDLAQHYSPSEVNRGLRFEETQEPILVAGYHHAWAPESHTLFMGARLQDSVSVTNPAQSVLLFDVTPSGQILNVDRIPQRRLDYQSELEIYAAELQHFWDWGNHRTIVGGRYQNGGFDTRNVMAPTFLIPATSSSFETDFERASVYGYHHWQAVEGLRLIAGVSYDWIHFPENFRSPPISGGQQTRDQVSPKAGLVWSFTDRTTVRAAYTRSLGGASIDQSFQLEPSQVAGFVQSFRSLIPESVVGSIAAPRNETFGVALDQKFPTRTYLGISAEWLGSKVGQQRGVYRSDFPGDGIPSTTHEQLDFRERTLRVSLNQLVGEEWALGLTYRLSHAELQDTFTEVPITLNPSHWHGGFVRASDLRALLHQAQFFGRWNSPSGFFAQGDWLFSSQSNDGYTPARPGDQFWQVNFFLGYRFHHRRAELSVGLLNITDQNYRLNPLNLTPELPRERTVALRLRFAL